MSTKGFASQARTRSGRRAAACVRLCGSKRDACPVCGAQVPRITLRAPGTNPDPDAGPPASDSQRGLSAPPSGGAVREPGPERNCRAEPRVRARSFRRRGRGRTCARRFLPPRRILPPRRRQWRWWSGGCGSGGPPPAAGLPGVSYQRPWGRGGRLRGRCLFRLGPKRESRGAGGYGGGCLNLPPLPALGSKSRGAEGKGRGRSLGRPLRGRPRPGA